MALRMTIQTEFTGISTSVDIAALRLHSFKLKSSYDHPQTLTFEAIQPNHTFPLGVNNLVRFWDDTLYNPDGTAQSEDRPMFLGYIRGVDVGSTSNSVMMTCYDATEYFSACVNCMSKAWIGTTTPAPDAEPRIVFNGRTISTDDDAFWERESYATVGRIIRVLLDDAQLPAGLFYASASPPYVIAELDQLNYEPQEKIVLEGQPVRKGILDVLTGSHGIKTRRLFWRPADRQWRFPDITQSPAVTLTLNQASGSVLSLDVRRSLEGRFTAIRIFGPPISVLTTATTEDGSLTDISDPIFVQSNPPTCCNVPALNRFQITDPNKRYYTMGLPYPVLAQFNDYNVGILEYPFLIGYYPNDTEAGYKGWRVIFDWYFEDKANGIIRLPSNTSAHRFNPAPESGQPAFEAPTAVRFVYGLPSAPLQVRSPTTGFSGTAYTVANLANEQQRREELLAAYYERWAVITTASRLAKWQILADYEQSLRRDIVYTGSVVLEGIVTGFAWLDRRVNFTAVDADGAAKTIGWEAINAVVTDVEYDFSEQTTTLTFSNDQAELIGLDTEQVKQRLKIAAAEVRRTESFAYVTTNIRSQRIGEAKRTQFSQLNSVWETSMRLVGGDSYFVNSVTGEVES